LILLFISISSLQASTFVVFQQNYVRDNNSPDLVTTPFTVANPGSFYFIRVTNGGLTDTPYEQVSSSTFSLNGAQIIGPSDFSQQVQVVERPVSLITNNSLSVELRGQPGGGVTVQIFGEDSEPPTITATVLPAPNAAGWSRSNLTVMFTCSDALSGIQSCPTPVVVSIEGANQTISGTTFDFAGNSATASLIVNLDKTAPSLQVASPADGAVLNQANLTINGSVSDSLSGVSSVTCNSTPALVSGNSFSCMITLVEGPNSVTVLGKDVAENERQTTLSVTLQTVITPSPLSGFIHGTVLNANTSAPVSAATVTADGIPGHVFSDNQGKFAYPTPGTGSFYLTVEKSGFTYVQRKTSVTTTRDTTLGTVLLTPKDPTVTTIGTAGGTATNSDGSVQIIFPVGAVTSNIPVRITRFSKSEQLPGGLNESGNVAQSIGYVFSADLEPDGISFSQPVTFKVVNQWSLPAGTPVPLAFWNRNTHLWNPTGSTAAISGDGQFLVGTLTHFSVTDANGTRQIPSGGGNYGDGNGCGSNECTCGGGDTLSSNIGYKDGSLGNSFSTTSIQAMGRRFAPLFEYSSQAANPNMIFNVAVSPSSMAQVPETTKIKLSIEGIEKSFFVQGSSLRQHLKVFFEGRNGRGNVLETGTYDYKIELESLYSSGASFGITNTWGAFATSFVPMVTAEPVSYATTLAGQINWANQSDSPFGSGWTLAGLQRLHFQPNGDVLLESPGERYMRFSKSRGRLNLLTDEIDSPIAMTFDPAGNMFVVDDRADITSDGVFKITPSGQISLFDSGFRNPVNIGFDLSGNLVLVDHSLPGHIYKYNGTSLPRTEFATTLDHPYGFAFDSAGNVYNTNNTIGLHDDVRTDDDTVSKTTPSGGTTTVISRKLGDPFYMTIDGDDNLYVATEKLGVLKMDTSGQVTGAYMGFGPLRDIESDAAGSLYVAELGSGLWKIDPSGQRTHLTEERVGFVALDNSGALHVSDFNNIYSMEFAEVDTYMGPSDDFSTLKRNADGTYTRTLKDQTRILFDSSGRQTSVIDTNGNETVYRYDSSGLLTEMQVPPQSENLIFQFQYAGGKLSSVVDPSGRATAITIDGFGNLVSFTNPDGSQIHYTYDSNHLMTAKQDSRGFQTGYVFDSYGRVSQANMATGEAKQYFPSDRQDLLDDLPAGTGTQTNPAPVVTVDQPARMIDGRGQTWTYDTCPNGCIDTIIDPLGRTTVYLRNRKTDVIAKMTRPNGSFVSYLYDSRGNLLSQTESFNGAKSTFTYDQTFNQVTSSRDPKGNLTVFSIDPANGNLLSTTDAQGHISSSEYNSRGQVIGSIDPLGNETQYNYNARGNLESIVDPLLNTTTYFYDNRGNVTTVRDPEGKETTTAYDLMDRVTTVTDARGSTTSYTYVPASGCPGCTGSTSLLSAVTDPNNHTTGFTYNEIGQLLTETNPLGQIRRNTYDFNRNLKTVTNRRGQVTTYNYDAANKLTSIVTPEDTKILQYDVSGNLTSAEDADSKLVMTYDALSRLLSVTTGGAAQYHQPNATITYQYDLNGNVTTRTDPTGVEAFVFDSLDRLLSQTHSQLGNTTFAYDHNSRTSGMTYANGVTSAYSYDAASRLQLLSYSKAGNPVYSEQNVYDHAGNRIQRTEDGTTTHVYTYDNAYQLLAASHSNQPAEFFTYDPTGNRLTSHLSSFYSYDNANRLLEDQEWMYIHDADGNLTSKTNKMNGDIHTYTFDSQNRMIAFLLTPGVFSTTQPVTADYRYDYSGNRIEKSVSNIAGTMVTRFIYEDQIIIAEYDGANSLIRSYQQGPSIDQPLAAKESTGQQTYISDLLGSIIRLTDSSGTPIALNTYDSFGQQLSGAQDRYSYTAREFDAESGLYYYRARYYQPGIGRFISEDAFGRISGIHFYLYVSNNPIASIDPLGLVAWSCRYSGATARAPLGSLTSLVFDCQSECIAGRSVIAVVNGQGVGGGTGFAPPIVVTWNATIQLQDGTVFPDGYNLAGAFQFKRDFGCAFVTLGKGVGGSCGGLRHWAGWWKGRSTLNYQFWVPCCGTTVTGS